MPYDETLATRIRQRLAHRDDVEEKPMFGGLTFMVAGAMACGVAGDELMVRLGREGAARWRDEPGARYCDFTGRVMRTMLLVAPAGCAGERLDGWIARALAARETGDG